eukprot:3825005-Amphidinium_carterae.3
MAHTHCSNSEQMARPRRGSELQDTEPAAQDPPQSFKGTRPAIMTECVWLLGGAPWSECNRTGNIRRCCNFGKKTSKENLLRKMAEAKTKAEVKLVQYSNKECMYAEDVE